MLCVLRGKTVGLALRSFVLLCFVCNLSFLNAKKMPWDFGPLVIDITSVSAEVR